MSRVLLLVLIASISCRVAMSTNVNMGVATGEMQKANYFTFVMLINMAPADLFPAGNITFLMPNDRTLSNTNVAGVVDFLLNHSIPSSLLIDNLLHLPTGSMIPTSRPGSLLRVTNNGRRRFFLNNVRVISANICTKTSFRCHGIDGVLHPVGVLQPAPAPSCRPNGTMPAAPLPAPSPPAPPAPAGNPIPTTAAPPPIPVPVHVSPPSPTSSSCEIGRGSRLLDSVTAFSMLFLVKRWLYDY